MRSGDEATPDSQDPVQPGEVLGGKFRVERVLGVGGMGVVVAATHLQLGQLVALKFMFRPATAHPEHVARFEREARAAVRLKSDHVAKVTDVGKLDDGAPYMVMEFLEGNDLDHHLERQGPLPVQLAVDFVMQACEAVAEAHSLGIVHRDLKPKNLFLTEKLGGKQVVKVLDFGISKMMDEAGDMSLTSTTQVMGSPNYMSPEQLRSARDVDARTDIWALGAILYELLTGRVPFPAESVTQLTAMVIADAPRPPSQLRPDLPRALEAVILKCLEKSREDRFATVADLVDALVPFASAVAAASVSGAVLATTGSGPRLSTTGGATDPGKITGNEKTILSDVPPPPDRPSLRVAGNSTDVAWDKTQVAEAAPSTRRRAAWPFVAGVLVAMGAAAGGFFAFHGKTATGSPTAPPPPAPTQSTVPAPPATTPAPPPLVVPTPSTRDPDTPPLVNGPDHPPPPELGLHHPPHHETAGAKPRVAAKPDAGARTAPVPSATTTATGGGDLLPSTRN